MIIRVGRGARLSGALAIGAIGLEGCSPGGSDSSSLLWAPFIVAVAIGLIAASMTIAIGFGRPGSAGRRLGYVVLALGLWFLLAIFGAIFVLVTNPV
jgi:hypothetical protein